MKTKGIPAVVMLLAGFVTCIIGIVQHMETDVFIKTLLAVLIIFYLYISLFPLVQFSLFLLDHLYLKQFYINYFLFIRMHCETGS